MAVVTGDCSGLNVRRGGSPPTGALSLSLLGGFELRLDDRPVKVPLSAQRVVAFLGLNQRRLARLYVAGCLWTDASEERAAAALRTALWRLGGAGRELVRCEEQSLRLNPEVPVDIDEATKISRAVLSSGASAAACPPRAVELLRDAGELLPDWYDDWVLMERERVRQLRLHALERLCLHFSDAGRHLEATEAGLAAVAAEPLRESAHRALVTAHLHEGNSGEALRQYGICRGLLRRQLAIAPSEAMETLVAHLRGGDARVTPFF